MTATGFLPDTGSNWFNRKHQSLDDNVGKPFIPGPESPLSIYNKPEVLDPFYAKTNVFHHHHHFIIPVHKHVKHIHHHHHHNHHIHHHTHPILVHHHHHHNHHSTHSDAHIYPGTLVSAFDHDAHQNKQHHLGTDLPIENTDFNAGHFQSSSLAIDPSIADAVSVSAIKSAQQNHLPAPVLSNVVTPGPLSGQTGYGLPSNHAAEAQTINGHQLNGYTYASNNAAYGNNQNTFAVPQESGSGFNQFTSQMGGTIPERHINSFTTENGINSGGNLISHGAGVTNSFGNGIDPIHSGGEVLANSHMTSETAIHAIDGTPLTGDHSSLHSALPVNHDIINTDTNSVENFHATPAVPQEVHNFVADSNGNELHEVDNLPLQFFSQGHHVTTVGDHASLEADHAVVEAGLSEDHPNHHFLDSLNEHHQEDGSIEHIMPSTGAIHVTEDSNGHIHKHGSNWNAVEHEGSHDLHVEEGHNKHPYAIHVSDNGHGYAVQADEYSDHENGHVEHVIENDLNHISGVDHADHITTDHGITDQGITDQGITDHGIVDHAITDHGMADHGMVDHGITDHGVVDHGMVDHGITDHGVVDHGITDHEIGDHGISDALETADAIDDHEGIVHQTDHVAVDEGNSDHEIIDHEHAINDQHELISHEIHDPGIHVNFHAIEHGHELHEGLDGLHNPPMSVHDHGHNEVGHMAGESVMGGHEITHVVDEHLHEEPHFDLHHDDHRDYHNGGVAPELIETNIHSNSVPEYNGNNPMTDIHDVTGHDTIQNVRHDIHDVHNTMNAGIHSTAPNGGYDALHGGIHDTSHDGIPQTLSGSSNEFDIPGHILNHAKPGNNPMQVPASNPNYEHEDLAHHSPHNLGVHGFDEHGEEFVINRGTTDHEGNERYPTQKDDTNPVDRSEENQVHLDEKDAELLKKAKDNEIVDPPYLTHLDPHGDGFGEGVVGGPDLNVGNDLQTSPVVSSSFPAIIPNSPPFVGNHPATMVHNGNIAPDYGSKRQKFENAKNNNLKSGYVSIGDPKKGSKVASNVKSKGKTVSVKPKLSKFIKGEKKESMSFFANDREKKEEQQTFETIPNEPRISLKTVSNEEKRKEQPTDSEKITSIGVEKENEHNMTNSVSSNLGKKEEEDQNSTKVAEEEKELEQNSETESQKETNGTDIGGETNGSTNDTMQANDDRNENNSNNSKFGNINEENNGTSTIKDTANDANEDKTTNEKKEEDVNLEQDKGRLQNTNQRKAESEAVNQEKVGNEEKLFNKTAQNPDGDLPTTNIVQNVNSTNEDQNNSLNGKDSLENKVKTKGKSTTGENRGNTETKDNNEISEEQKGTQEDERTKSRKEKSKKKENIKVKKEEEKPTIDSKESQEKNERDKNPKRMEKQGNKAKAISENSENLKVRDSASESGEGSGETDRGNEKKISDEIEDKQKNLEEKDNKENDKKLINDKETTNENNQHDELTQSMKEENESSKENKEDNLGSEQAKGDDKNLNKSKAKGKKGDRNKDDEEEDGDLGDEKVTGGDAENNPGGTAKEKIKEDNATSVTEAKNKTMSSAGESKPLAENRKETERLMTDNSTTFSGSKKYDKSTEENQHNKTKYDNYGSFGSQADINSYAKEIRNGNNKGSENDEMQKVDEEGRTIERNRDDKGEEKSTHSSDQNGFEKVGPQKSSSRVMNSKEATKSEGEKINVSVDKEEWQSSEDKNEEKQSSSGDKDIESNQENLGNSANGLITIKENDMSKEVEPTESPTQFYISDNTEGSGLVKTPTESVSTQPDAVQVTTEKNNHELDGIAKSQKDSTENNDDNTAVRDPIDIIESNTATVHDMKTTAGDEKDLGEESTQESSINEESPTRTVTYSNLEDKSTIEEQKPTDSLIRKRNQQPRYENKMTTTMKDTKKKKGNLAKRLKGKRKIQNAKRIDRHSMTSNIKSNEKTRKRRQISLIDIFRRFLFSKAVRVQ